MPDSVQTRDGAPADAQHARRFVGEHLELRLFVRCGGDVVDQLQFPVRLEQPGVRPDAVHPHALQVLRRRDQHVGHRARRQFDDQIVDRITRRPLDHVEGQDVGAHRAERHGK